MRTPSRARRALIGLLAATAVLAGALVGTTAQPAQALSGGDFNPGFIISDAVFYNPGAMSSAQVQGWLAAQVPSCAAGYTCLKDYRQTTTSRGADAKCGAYTGVANQLASDIIFSVSQACGINPQVLIVLLQKEEGLVLSRAPSASAYKIATGYGCPDTAACDSTYYGFYNQLMSAARQFKTYQSSPNSFSYRAGRNNAIQWNPNAACGATTVYIQNQATAGLYNYTPYVPNAAALANLTGIGNSCSSYGNRNFWVYFSSWFGNPQGGGSFAKSASSDTVYLLTADHKYPVPSIEILNSYAALGPYRTVSSDYLDEFTTGPALGQLVRDPTTTAIYYFDLGVKHHAISCDQLVDWGTSCSKYIDLTPAQIQALTTGADLSSFAHSPANNAVYYVHAGTKSWVHSMDKVIALNNGSVPAFTDLGPTALATLTDAPDVVTNGSVIQPTGQSAMYLVDGATRLVPVAAAGIAADYAGSVTPVAPVTLTSRTIDTSTTLAPVAVCSGKYYLASGGQLVALSSNSSFGLRTTTLDQTTCDAIPRSTTVVGSTLLVRSTAGAIYFVGGGVKRHVLSMDAVYALNGGSTALSLVTLSDATLAAIGGGADILTPAQLVKSASAPNIYLVDGATRKVPIDMFETAAEFGISGYSVVSDAALGGYTAAGAPLSITVNCSASIYVAGGGQLYRIASNSSSGLPVTTLDAMTCALLPKSGATVSGALFLRSTATGAIYSVAGGTKTHLTTMASVYALNGGALPIMIPLSTPVLAKIPG